MLFFRERRVIVASKSSLSKVSVISSIINHEWRTDQAQGDWCSGDMDEERLALLFNHKSLQPDVTLCRVWTGRPNIAESRVCFTFHTYIQYCNCFSALLRWIDSMFLIRYVLLHYSSASLTTFLLSSFAAKLCFTSEFHAKIWSDHSPPPPLITYLVFHLFC